MTRQPNSVIACIALGVVDLASTLVRRLHGQQQGQVLVLVAGLLSVFGGMTAVAIDLGSYSADRRDLQNSADAIALAASQELPDGGAVLSVANQWAVKNGIDPSAMSVEVIPQSASEPNPKVRVSVEENHEFTFARLVGVNSATVSASAAAIKSSPAGGDNVVPLAVTEATLVGITVNDEVTLKYDANDITNGNTGPIVIDDTGTGNCRDGGYCSGLQEGSDGIVCAVGEDPTYCDGPSTVNTSPGNVTGPTRDAIQFRLDNTSLQCDEFAEVFEDDPETSEPDVFRIVNECNPYLEGGYDSMRVLIIPVIDQLCSTGSCPVTITGFALFFLEGFGEGGCDTGQACEIVGRFVQVNQNVGLLAGTFDPNAFDHFTRLVE